MYYTLTNFIQRKRKTYDASDLLALSLVSVIVFIHFLGKSFILYIWKQQNGTILSYAKPITQKMCQELVKIWKKGKNMRAFFQYFQSWYENKEKTQICFVGINILNNNQNTKIFTQQQQLDWKETPI